MRQILEGLKIIENYLPAGSNCDFSAEHDIVYVGFDGLADELTKEDKKKMEELGWMLDETEHHYSHFC